MKKLIVFSFCFLLILGSCNIIGGERIKGNGNIKTENRQAASFVNVSVSGNIDLYVHQDSAYNVRVEADENLLEYIEIITEGEDLIIRPRKGYNLNGTRDIKVYVSSPSYNKLEASGSCDIKGENIIKSETRLDIDLNGSSDVNMEINVPEVRAELSGSGLIALSGITKNFSVTGSGSTDIKCMDLKSENVSVRISGAGSAKVFASVKLDVHVSGSGSVEYKGSATVNQNISGAGSVKKIE